MIGFLWQGNNTGLPRSFEGAAGKVGVGYEQERYCELLSRGVSFGAGKGVGKGVAAPLFEGIAGRQEMVIEWLKLTAMIAR